MNVNISIETIEELLRILHKYDAGTERFITDLSTSDKYDILALIMMVRGNFEDFEEAQNTAKEKIPEHELNKYFMGRSSDNWQTLHGELQDIIAIQKRDGWEWFEFVRLNGNADEDEEQ
jgi:hypothetical protein